MSDKIISVLESFQEFTGKKIQRLYRSVPNVCAFYTLGWMGLERLVEVKKLSFIRSILALDDDVGTKVAFLEWSNYSFDNPDYCRENSFRSPVYDLLLAVLVEKSLNLVYVSLKPNGKTLYGREPGN